MKNLIRSIFVILFVTFSFSGCEKIKDLSEVKFDASFTADMEVNVPSMPTKALNGVFYATATVDPLSNSDLAKYAQKIKEIDLAEVTIEVLSISSYVKLITASLIATCPNYQDVEWTISNQPIDSGTILTLGNENGQFDNLNKILDSLNKFTVTLSGQTDVDEATFVLRIKFKTRVKADALS